MPAYSTWPYNEELLKLRKKTTTTVQVLTHLKEKLQFVQKDNEVLGAGMESLEYGLMSKRENLQQLKLERDKLRGENGRMKVGPEGICFSFAQILYA